MSKLFACSGAQVMNPPLLGVLAGIAVGACPLGALLYQPSSPAAFARAARLPLELRACLGALSATLHAPLCCTPKLTSYAC
jgi:hypothetical protein